jgi:beta-lactam-binding protein with PASTA domain
VAYVAPELVSDGEADPRSDVYSVGIVLFEMLTGRVPYDGSKPIDIAWAHVDQDVPPPSKYVPGLPNAIDQLVGHATHRDRAQRPSDAGVMLTEVQAVHDRLEGQTALSDKTVAAPTVTVGLLGGGGGGGGSGGKGGAGTKGNHAGGSGRRGRASGGSDRPSWSRLPERERDRAVPPRRSADGPRGGGSSGRGSTRGSSGGFVGWFDRLMSRRNGRRTFYATIAVLAVVVALTGWWFGFGRYTTTPKFVGQTQAQAVAAATKAGFEIRYGSPLFEEKIPKNTVVGQQPAASERIRRGGVIMLTLSRGPERYAVPSDVGKPFDVVQSDLNELKMVVRRVDAYNDAYPADYVVSLNPKPGSVQPPGTQITVTVSKGKAPITVPKVVGMDFNTANQTLTNLGLTVAQTPKQSDQPAGQVIAQSLPPGSGAVTGASIILTVSAGPPQVQVPNVSGLGYSFDQAAQILQQAGLQAVKVADFPGGQVRNQNPAPGTTVAQGTQVQLWVLP